MNAMWHLVWPAVAFAAVLFAALVVRGLLKRVLRRRMRAPDALAAFLKAVRVPSLLWAAVVALWLAIEVSELPRRITAQLEVAFQVALILSITFTLASVVAALIGLASERRALGGPVTGLAQTASRVTVLVVGVLVLLSVLGIHITPILTALGVGGLAVALALQDSLANLFAGMHLLADKPIRVGDYVKIADTTEGYVVDIGWRSTWATRATRTTSSGRSSTRRRRGWGRFPGSSPIPRRSSASSPGSASRRSTSRSTSRWHRSWTSTWSSTS